MRRSSSKSSSIGAFALGLATALVPAALVRMIDPDVRETIIDRTTSRIASILYYPSELEQIQRSLDAKYLAAAFAPDADSSTMNIAIEHGADCTNPQFIANAQEAIHRDAEQAKSDLSKRDFFSAFETSDQVKTLAGHLGIASPIKPKFDEQIPSAHQIAIQNTSDSDQRLSLETLLEAVQGNL